MNPQQQQPNQPTAPSTPPVQTTPPIQPVDSLQPETPVELPKKSHKKLALILLIGPTALLIVAILGSAIANVLAGSPEPDPSTGLFAENPVKVVTNVILFLVGTITVITWLPGIIIGIVLLAKKK
ncbi:MAG TPA: hypothetical protein VK502_02910 [Candidatus Saccharimonadales bacterium]|nr:hypothetical protein [Candidatus Saccharimonadales bacterium]